VYTRVYAEPRQLILHIAWRWSLAMPPAKASAAALMIASVQSSLRTAALFTGNDLCFAETSVHPQNE
jgi:hypothetical protein